MDAFEEMYLGAEGALRLKLSQLEEAIARYKNPDDTKYWKWNCPGCEYAACPSAELLIISPRK